MTRPIVAIVGRANVGKSTLFNRLMGAPLAVVHEAPGTTRDRIYGTAEWGGREFILVDTGGIAADPEGELGRAVLSQVDVAIDQADVILFLTDLRSGPVPADAEVADRLRRTSKPVILAVNKGDSARDRVHAPEFYELGLESPTVVSALRGIGTGDLLDRIIEALPGEPPADGDVVVAESVSIAIVGRPNVGKSSLLNALVGGPRAIVAEAPGTTRDALDTEIEYQGNQLRLIDTAGIRRRGRIAPGVEAYSVLRALRAIDRAEVAVLLLDAEAGLAAQDSHVAGYIHEAAKGCVIAVNKWDLLPPSPELGAHYVAEVRKQLPFLEYAPIVFLSAKTGLHVARVLESVLRAMEQRDRRIPTAPLNEFLRGAFTSHPHSHRGKVLKLLYATQASVRPPTFVLFVNDPELVHFAYQRYLDNQLRWQFGFEGTGLRLVFRHRSG